VDEESVRNARDVVAAMQALAARLGVPRLTEEQLQAMRDANDRFTTAIEAEDAEAALAADDAFHDVLVVAAENPAIVSVLEQYTPVVRRAETLRFLSIDRFASAERHAQLIDLCAAGDAEGASRLAFHTWHS